MAGFNAPAMAALANFATVFFVKAISGPIEPDSESAYSQTLAKRFQRGEKPLRLDDIEGYIKGSTPPNRKIIVVMVCILPFTVPWLPIPGRIGIMPAWAAVCLFFVVVSLVLYNMALESWKPAPKGDGAEMLEVS